MSALRVAAVLAFVLALVVVASGCLAGAAQAPEAGGPPFRPDAFFLGETRGFGTIQIRGQRPRVLQVASTGVALSDSTFRLDQSIRLGGQAPTERTWTMTATAPEVWAGTLSDADGETTATLEGSVLRIRYHIGRFTTMDQRLTLEPDGRAALNLATVRFLGLPVARIVERIRRVDTSGDA
ncbi:DUF3833 family protein [Rubrivirga sp. IMCC45206]|uniref:DUF3833 family protein n=1 Tax=Rubrivirga sp. IMCC45206 TaxID=3391614 RepID=UPI00398FB8D6